MDHKRVRRHFSTRASSYDRHATVQKEVVGKLATLLDATGCPVGPVLEVGSGTGMLSERLMAVWPGIHPLLSDLAHDMNKVARERLGKLTAVDADCRALPFKSETFDLVCSSSVYQWIEELSLAFAESARVLTPGGRFAFALFGRGTLWELQESYRYANRQIGREPLHLHVFPDPDHIRQALEEAGFRDITLHLEDRIEYHAEVADLLRGIKGIGAANASPLRPSGLASKRIMQGMMARYLHRFGEEQGIPATYKVIYVVTRKAGGSDE